MSRHAVPPSGGQIELAHGDQRAVVVEVGGALRRFAVGVREVLDGYDADERCTDARGQTLVPWPNRLRDGRYAFEGAEHQLPLTEPPKHNAIHGLVRWLPFRAEERTAGSVVMRQRLPAQSGYPFSLEVGIAYALGDGGLRVETTARNVGTHPCPYGAGAHPYLMAGPQGVDDLVLRAPGRVRLTADDRQIPVGETPVDDDGFDFRAPRRIGDAVLDTAFTDLERDGDGLARVELSHEDTTTTLWMDTAYRYLMLFTGDTLPEPRRRRRSLGVEPMTCAPNAFVSGAGLEVLQPGDSTSAVWGITVT